MFWGGELDNGRSNSHTLPACVWQWLSVHATIVHLDAPVHLCRWSTIHNDLWICVPSRPTRVRWALGNPAEFWCLDQLKAESGTISQQQNPFHLVLKEAKYTTCVAAVKIMESRQKTLAIWILPKLRTEWYSTSKFFGRGLWGAPVKLIVRGKSH